MARLRLIEPGRKEPDSEKITINLGYIDLGRIDLLVQEGFYSNRTDFIRTAIRAQLGTHGDVLQQTVARRSLVLGLQRYTRQDLERLRAAGEQLHIQVLGLATIDDDVPAQLAAQTIASFVVLGALRASAKVKAALADRIRQLPSYSCEGTSWLRTKEYPSASSRQLGSRVRDVFLKPQHSFNASFGTARQPLKVPIAMRRTARAARITTLSTSSFHTSRSPRPLV